MTRADPAVKLVDLGNKYHAAKKELREAVMAVVDKGDLPLSMVAQITGVSERVVYRWVKQRSPERPRSPAAPRSETS